jgi:drug/metabolite transporter (DMT)-like permease
MVILSLGPLLTMFFAVAHRLEPFSIRGLAGALIALGGIAVGVGAQFGASIPVPSIAALVIAVACIAEGSVIYKLLPHERPLPANVVAFSVGSTVLVLISLVAGESWILPSDTSTVLAFSYLVLFGSVGLFYLYLFVLSNWTASATSYAFLLFPLATIVIASLVAGERVTVGFLIGAAAALLGVWIGAFSKKSRAAARARAAEQAENCSPPHPGCA